MATFLFEDKLTSVIKFSWWCDQFLHRYEPTCGKMFHFEMLKNTWKNS